MNLYIYSDLLFNNDSQTSTSGSGVGGGGTSTLLSYSKLLKDSSTRSQFFGNQSLPRKVLVSQHRQHQKPLGETLPSTERQTRTYLVDLNKQSLDSFSTLNLATSVSAIASPKTTRTSSVSSRKPTNENQMVVSRAQETSGRNPFEVIEGSRMKIREKRLTDDSASTQFRLKVFNGFAKNLPKIDQIEKSMYKPSFKPKVLVASNELSNKKKQLATSLNETVISKASSISCKDRSNQHKNVASTNQQQQQETKVNSSSEQQRKSMTNISEYLLKDKSVSSHECSTQMIEIDQSNTASNCCELDEDVTIRDELKYRVDSPHKLSKSEPEGYKFASNSSMNLERHRQKHKFIHEHFDLYQSSYFSTN